MVDFRLRLGRTVATDCVLSAWQFSDPSCCEAVVGGGGSGGWDGVGGATQPARVTATATQTRRIVQLRDAEGFGADCARVGFGFGQQAQASVPAQPGASSPSSAGVGAGPPEPGDIQLIRSVQCSSSPGAE